MNEHEKPAQCKTGCGGTDIRMTLRILKNGTPNHHWQCRQCGRSQTGAVRKALALKMDPNPIDWDAGIIERYDNAWQARYAQAREAKRDERRRWYNEVYLKSPEWRTLRAKRLGFDRGVCQGCLEAPATQVHHRTYNNIGDELLYQLISLCRPCHEKAHKND